MPGLKLGAIPLSINFLYKIPLGSSKRSFSKIYKLKDYYKSFISLQIKLKLNLVCLF